MCNWSIFGVLNLPLIKLTIFFKDEKAENLNSIELFFLLTILPLPIYFNSFSAKGLSLILKVIPNITLSCFVIEI